MHYPTIKWILFLTLFCAAPALLFFVVAVMFMPAVFIAAAMVGVIPKLFSPGHAGESLAFLFILGIHALVYLGLYYGLAVILARLIERVRTPRGRNGLVLAICSGLLTTTLLPIYGSGGHGPMRWVNLPALLAEIDRSYGSGTVALVYGAALLVVLGLRWLRNRWPKTLA